MKDVCPGTSKLGGVAGAGPLKFIRWNKIRKEEDFGERITLTELKHQNTKPGLPVSLNRRDSIVRFKLCF